MVEALIIHGLNCRATMFGHPTGSNEAMAIVASTDELALDFKCGRNIVRVVAETVMAIVRHG